MATAISRRTALLALATALTMGLAACGRKGRLDPPDGADPKKSEVQLPNPQ